MNTAFHPDIFHLKCVNIPFLIRQSEGGIHHIAIIGLYGLIQILPWTKAAVMLLHAIIHLIIYISHQFMGSDPSFMLHPCQIMKQNLFLISARIFYRAILACIEPFHITYQLSTRILTVQAHQYQLSGLMQHIRHILTDTTVYIVDCMII